MNGHKAASHFLGRLRSPKDKGAPEGRDGHFQNGAEESRGAAGSYTREYDPRTQMTSVFDQDGRLAITGYDSAAITEEMHSRGMT